MRNYFIIFILIFFSYNSYSKVGDRFNCVIIDSVSTFAPLLRKYKFRTNQEASKFMLITILDNEKASLEHEYDKNIIPFKKYILPSNAAPSYEVYRYTSTIINPLSYSYHELTGFFNGNKYTYFTTSIPHGNNELFISSYECTKLS